MVYELNPSHVHGKILLRDVKTIGIKRAEVDREKGRRETDKERQRDELVAMHE